MGVLADILRFIGIFFGMKDSSRVFAESLESSERYLRWAQERQDPRDYMSALRHCEACNDDDAPKGEAILRKYSMMIEIIIGLLRVNLYKYRMLHNSALSTLNTIKNDIESVKKNISHSRKVVKRMQEEGNMLKAQDEESNIEDMERHLSRLRARLDNNPDVLPLGEKHRVLKDEVMHYKLRLELSYSSLQQLENISAEMKESMIRGAKTQMDNLEMEIISLEPANHFTLSVGADLPPESSAPNS